MSRGSYLYITVELQTRVAENSRPPSNSMTTNENTNSGSNVTALNALADIPRISVLDDLEDLSSLASVAETVDASTRFDATDFPAIANAMAGVESPTPVANAAIDAMYTPSILKSVASIRSSALAASTALGTMATPAVHDAASSVGGITASINAATDFEQSIETFGGPSTLAGTADIFALNALNSFETVTSPFLAGIAAEMEEVANQTEFAPLFSNDSVSQLALLTTDYDLSDVLSSHEEYTESSVDRDFQWSVAKCVYHSVRLNLEQLEISIDDKRSRNLLFLSYLWVFLYTHTSYSPSVYDFVIWIATWVLSEPCDQE